MHPLARELVEEFRGSVPRPLFSDVGYRKLSSLFFDIQYSIFFSKIVGYSATSECRFPLVFEYI